MIPIPGGMSEVLAELVKVQSCIFVTCKSADWRISRHGNVPVGNFAEAERHFPLLLVYIFP
jgi:hypothetical protein